MLWIAVDTDSKSEADDLAEIALANKGLVGLKLGLEFYTAHGKAGVSRYDDVPVFLDLKFHDIPNTVAKAVRNCRQLHPALMTVHSGCAASAVGYGIKIVVVTRLTSQRSSGQDVLEIAKQAKADGAAGVICPVAHLEQVRKQCGPDFLLVTPGIRPAWAMVDDDDQVMFATPADAKLANHVVVGRPITRSQDPAAAVSRILEEWHVSNR